MKNKFLSFLVIFMTIVFIGCGSSSAPKPIVKEKKTIVSGVVQKGPFLQGSIAKIFKLDGDYERTSQMLQTTISGNDGAYSFDDISWSGLSEIEVTGRFLDENTGLDTRTATVTSVVNVQEDGTVNTNVNVLTHMASGQVKKLLKEGKTLDEANYQVVREVFNILGRTNLTGDDFGDLNAVNIFDSDATANTELLFFSAALLRSDDYMADLEALLTLYKDGGIDAVLGSAIYARLMQNRQEIDELAIIENVIVDTSGVTDIQKAEIVVPMMAKITKSILSNIIELRLYGTKFTSRTPSINLTVSGGTVTKGDIVISDDNRSATIAVIGAIGGCKDVNVTATIDYMDLEGTINPLVSNKINMRSSMSTTLCTDDDNDGIETINFPNANKPPVAIIGMLDNSEDGQQASKSITVAVGTIVGGLDTYYSYDQDPYPQGGITHCEYTDATGEVLKSSNSNDCGIYDKVFDVAGEYIYTLTVTDNRGATNSNTVTINAEAIDPNDELPVAKIDEVNTTVNKQIYAGNAPYATAGGTDDNGIVYCKWSYSGETKYEKTITTLYQCLFDFPTLKIAGNYIYTLTVRDTIGQEDTNDLNVTVLANAIPTASIGANRNLEVGDILDIRATVGDTDDDDMTYQWMYGIKDSGSMSGAGSILDFSHQFNDAGLYEVTFRVADEHNANITVKIDVNVTEAIAPVGTVTIGDLMWEDTDHTRSGTVDNWAASETYCDGLELGTFGNWRLASVKELRGIMDSNGSTSKAIIDGFVQFTSTDGVTSWTSIKNGESEHMVGWFTGGNGNLDGLGDGGTGVGVRCVRAK